MDEEETVGVGEKEAEGATPKEVFGREEVVDDGIADLFDAVPDVLIMNLIARVDVMVSLSESGSRLPCQKISRDQ